MRVDALLATGGKTYAQMPRYASKDGKGTDDLAAAIKLPNGVGMPNPARNVWITETALTTALNTSYMAEQISLFGIAVGGAFLLVGLGFGAAALGAVRLPKLAVPRRPARSRPRRSPSRSPSGAPGARRCSAERSRASGAPRGDPSRHRGSARARPARDARGGVRGRRSEETRVARRVRRATPASSSARPRSRRRAGAPRSAAGRRSSRARASPAKRSLRPASSAASSACACTSATLPSPPHCTLTRPPGRSAAASRANSASWSAIQWKVALEKTASTRSPSASVSVARSAWRTSTGSPASSSRARATMSGDASTAMTPPARQPLEQHAGDAARAAAGVEHGLVAAQLEAVEHGGGPLDVRTRDPVVGLRVPVAHLPAHVSAVVTGPPRSRSRS